MIIIHDKVQMLRGKKWFFFSLSLVIFGTIGLHMTLNDDNKNTIIKNHSVDCHGYQRPKRSDFIVKYCRDVL